MSKPDGGTAFPLAQPEIYEPAQNGMSLRDWFAGQALCGAIACPESTGAYLQFAAEAYEYADAMLAERNKEQPITNAKD